MEAIQRTPGIPNITLSPQQETGIEKVRLWYEQWKAGDEKARQYFYLAGYAGTGKSTIAKLFESFVKGQVMYATYTGKAALVLRRKGAHSAQTIHRLIYKPDSSDEEKSSEDPVFVLDRDSELRFASLLILDECSMVDQDLAKDLLSFGVPILVLGDPGQLPPVKGTGFFTNRKADHMLTEVHRQALESPIVRVATDIRNGKSLAKMNEPDCIVYPKASEVTDDFVLDYEQILTGKNNTRHACNRRVRSLRSFTNTYPHVGERVIGLRNNRQTGVFNGLIGDVSNIHSVDEYEYVCDILTEDNKPMPRVHIHEICWSNLDGLGDLTWRERKMLDEFTFGYCITVHKAQGSQWESVFVLDDGMLTWDKANRKRWLYTAVTRAEKKLVIARK